MNIYPVLDYCEIRGGGRIECDGLCELDPVTSEPICKPSCATNNGGCAPDEWCVPDTSSCISFHCPEPEGVTCRQLPKFAKRHVALDAE